VLNYVVITPAKNEAEHIAYILNSMSRQTHLPKQWIIVDDGSTDKTAELVSQFAQKFSWIKLVRLTTSSEERMGGSKVVRAFEEGMKKLDESDFDFVTKLDADLTLEENYFEKISDAFSHDKKLGICGGYIINIFSDGRRVVERSDDSHVRGALKSIRKECWEAIGGFKQTWYWDSLDIMEARFLGWETKSLDLPVLHHRPTTSAYNATAHAFKSGYESYKIGADIFLTLLRCLFRLHWRPRFLVSFSFLKGFITASIRKEKLIVSQELAKFIRRFHYQRILKSLRLKR